MKSLVWLTAALFLSASAASLLAQQGQDEGRDRGNRQQRGDGQQRGGPDGRGFLRFSPVTAALDSDNNGEISMQEIENAVATLKGLDKDKNGKLTEDELRPNFAGREGGFGGFGSSGRGPGGGGAEGMVARWMESDANKDGKLSKDELPERLQGFLARADSNQDGVWTKEELTAMANRFGGGAGGGAGGPGGRPEAGGRGPGSSPNPEAFVNRALEFDADKDGKLSKEELGKMAEQMGRGFGGGPGGRGGDDRPQRPQRPERQQQ